MSETKNKAAGKPAETGKVEKTPYEIELEAKVEKLEAEAKIKDEAIAEAKAYIDELSAEKKTGRVHVKHDGKDYKVTLRKFKFEGVVYAAEDLKENKALVAKLIKLESTILKQL